MNQPSNPKTKRSRQRGSSMVELTLLTPVWTSLILGTWLFGYTFYVYNGLGQAVRAGARYASMLKYDSSNSTPSASYLAAVQNMVVYGDSAPATGAQPVVSGLSTSNVAVTMTFANNVPTAVTVGITSFVVPGFLGRITLNNKPQVQFPFVGIYGPA